MTNSNIFPNHVNERAFSDSSLYDNSAFSSTSDRPAKLEEAPLYNGYKNVYN